MLANKPATLSIADKNSMKIKASGSTIVIRRIDAPVNGKIHIPDKALAEMNAQHGIVVSVGPGPRDIHGNRHAMEFKDGDHVVFNRLGIVNITTGEDALCAVKEQDIFGVVEPTE